MAIGEIVKLEIENGKDKIGNWNENETEEKKRNGKSAM